MAKEDRADTGLARIRRRCIYAQARKSLDIIHRTHAHPLLRPTVIPMPRPNPTTKTRNPARARARLRKRKRPKPRTTRKRKKRKRRRKCLNPPRSERSATPPPPPPPRRRRPPRRMNPRARRPRPRQRRPYRKRRARARRLPLSLRPSPRRRPQRRGDESPRLPRRFVCCTVHVSEYRLFSHVVGPLPVRPCLSGSTVSLCLLFDFEYSSLRGRVFTNILYWIVPDCMTIRPALARTHQFNQFHVEAP